MGVKPSLSKDSSLFLWCFPEKRRLLTATVQVFPSLVFPCMQTLPTPPVRKPNPRLWKVCYPLHQPRTQESRAMDEMMDLCSGLNKHSEMDVAPWCSEWNWDWISRRMWVKSIYGAQTSQWGILTLNRTAPSYFLNCRAWTYLLFEKESSQLWWMVRARVLLPLLRAPWTTNPCICLPGKFQPAGKPWPCGSATFHTGGSQESRMEQHPKVNFHIQI